ncbi:hypothetical protein C8R45DRAFT_929675 [Mycena sanguinolenta]|nr:hypothetical protein C8R45DRAFT_929675 [Mycena sanguinolenta]
MYSNTESWLSKLAQDFKDQVTEENLISRLNCSNLSALRGQASLKGCPPANAETPARWVRFVSPELPERDIELLQSCCAVAKLSFEPKLNQRQWPNYRIWRVAVLWLCSANGWVFVLQIENDPDIIGCDEATSHFISEVATLAWVRKNTAIPVPEVDHHAFCPDNPVGARYMIMEMISGPTLSRGWLTVSPVEWKKVLTEIGLPCHALRFNSGQVQQLKSGAAGPLTVYTIQWLEHALETAFALFHDELEMKHIHMSPPIPTKLMLLTGKALDLKIKADYRTMDPAELEALQKHPRSLLMDGVEGWPDDSRLWLQQLLKMVEQRKADMSDRTSIDESFLEWFNWAEVYNVHADEIRAFRGLKKFIELRPLIKDPCSCLSFIDVQDIQPGFVEIYAISTYLETFFCLCLTRDNREEVLTQEVRFVEDRGSVENKTKYIGALRTSYQHNQNFQPK